MTDLVCERIIEVVIGDRGTAIIVCHPRKIRSRTHATGARREVSDIVVGNGVSAWTVGGPEFIDLGERVDVYGECHVAVTRVHVASAQRRNAELPIDLASNVVVAL